MILARAIDRLFSITVSDKNAWTGNIQGEQTISINNDSLFGGDSSEGGLVCTLNFQPGYATQMPDSYLQKKLGAGIPATRGVASIVCRQGYLGNNPYLKDWSFRGSRIHTKDDGSTQWYDAKSEVKWGADYSVQLGPTSTGWKYKVIDLTDQTDYSSPTYDDSSWATGTMPFANAAGHPYAASAGFPATMGTFWTKHSTIWIRRTFNFSTTGTLSLVIFVDNYATVWVNGTKVLARSGTSDTPSGPNFTHEFTIPAYLLKNGANVLAVKGEDVGDAGSSGNWAYAATEVDGSDPGAPDMNPAHVLRECLTNGEWGYSYDDDDIDDTSFMAAADTLYAEGMGVSYLWDDQSTEIDDVVEKVLEHINGTLYVDRRTQLWTLVLIRADYDPTTLHEFTEGVDIIEMNDFNQPGFAELVNTVQVTYYDLTLGQTATVTVSDPALLLQQGVVVSQQNTYEMLSNANIASRVAQRDLANSSQPLASGTIYLVPNQYSNALHRGSVLKVTFAKYGLQQSILRVTSITFGNTTTKVIKVSFVQDGFVMPDTAVVTPTNPQIPVDSTVPVPATYRLVQEVPYFYLAREQGQGNINSILNNDPTVGYLGVAAGRDDPNMRAEVWVDPGSGYAEAANLDFCPVGILLSGVAMLAGTFTFDLTLSTDLDQVSAPGFACIEGEWVYFTGVTVTGTAASITGVLGAQFDTTPATHAAGAAVFFCDGYIDSDEKDYENGESVNVEILTIAGSGQLSLAAAPIDTQTFKRRAWAPYPPANVRVNGALFPQYIKGDFALTWASRNRLTQADQSVAYTSGGATPEAGVTYTLALTDQNGTLRRTYSGITGANASQTWTTETADCNLSSAGAAVTHDESFAQALRTGYGTLIAPGAASSTAVYDGVQHAVALTGTTEAETVFDISSLPFMYDFTVEVDCEMLSDSSTSALKHFGIWLLAPALDGTGYRCAYQSTLTPAWNMARMASWASNTILNPSSGVGAPPALNTRMRLKVTWTASTGTMSFYVNNVLVATTVDTTYSQLRPGIEFYHAAIRLHEVKVTGHMNNIRENNQVTFNLKATRDIDCLKPTIFTVTRVGYGYSYGASYGGM
jgi:hypothetical protein